MAEELRITRGSPERLRATAQGSGPFATTSGLRFVAKRRLSDADEDAVVDKTIGNGIVITVAGDSVIPWQALITIDPEDTATLPNQQHPPVILRYNLVNVDKYKLASGEIIVEPEVLISG